MGLEGDVDCAPDWLTLHRSWFPQNLDNLDAEGPLLDLLQDNALPIGRVRELFGLAVLGKLSQWTLLPAGRLTLLTLLSQSGRLLYGGTRSAFDGDATALRLSQEGLACGHYDALSGFWERIFFLLPLVNVEGECHLERVEIALVATERLTSGFGPDHPMNSPALFFAEQRRTIARFGRFPARNSILGRASTPEEIEYVDGLGCTAQQG